MRGGGGSTYFLVKLEPWFKYKSVTLSEPISKKNISWTFRGGNVKLFIVNSNFTTMKKFANFHKEYP